MEPAGGPPDLVVVGGGLAGCEAAWQAAQRGLRVLLLEMRPLVFTPAHHTDGLAELVCSNSLGSDALENASGLLKEEMRRMGSLIMACADRSRVPAGKALAVDRREFSALVTHTLCTHPLIRVRREEVTVIPPEPAVLATGGLSDPRVTYWEPEKWVAKLRPATTSGKPVMLKINMDAGHGGASGRFEFLKEIALDYAFAVWAVEKGWEA
ncbi:MAG: FAD-dependent oxidoreductase, partial [Acetobacteraceae bacterium]|nr:FAD-dependent oxidoreductase [Acetobacteraceae bacterium]